MNDEEHNALRTLNDWLAKSNRNISESTENAWRVTAFKDSYIFSPGGGRRANALYLVKETEVVVFSPSMETTDQAYQRAAATS